MTLADSTPLSPEDICTRLHEQTLQACQLARMAAGIVAEGIATGVSSLLDGVRQREKELDVLDRDEGAAIRFRSPHDLR